VLCPANTTLCLGTRGSDLLIDAAGGGFVQGGPSRDIYVATGGPNSDMYWDRSTSSDLYGGFENGQFPAKIIWDEGGVDRLDLSMITSAYASTDFAFVKADVDSDGKEDDLRILETNVDYGADDEIRVIAHFGSGRIEYIKFSDKTLSGSNLPLAP
jgi:hypothetical protein